jgi:hypothetical protein
MNKEEVSKVLLIAMAIDSRLNVNDQNLFIAKVEGWHLALSKSMTFEFARDAVGQHYSKSNNSIMPADLNTLWRVQVDRDTNATKMSEIGPGKSKNGMPESVRVYLREVGLLR